MISNVTGTKVTIETPKPVHRREIVGLLRATLEGQNLELVSDTAGPYRIRQKEQPQPPPAASPVYAGGLTQLFVIHLRHARAADVAATVNALYGRASAFGEMGAPQQPHLLSQQLQQNQVAMAGVLPVPAVPGDLTNGHQANLSGETTIVPDAGTNSLLIRASQSRLKLDLGGREGVGYPAAASADRSPDRRGHTRPESLVWRRHQFAGSAPPWSPQYHVQRHTDSDLAQVRDDLIANVLGIGSDPEHKRRTTRRHHPKGRCHIS